METKKHQWRREVLLAETVKTSNTSEIHRQADCVLCYGGSIRFEVAVQQARENLTRTTLAKDVALEIFSPPPLLFKKIFLIP